MKPKPCLHQLGASPNKGWAIRSRTKQKQTEAKMGLDVRFSNSYSFIRKSNVAITKAKKEEILAKLQGVRENSDSIVFVNFNALTVAESTAMRNKLREEGVGYFVAKKTLMKRAFEGAFEGEMPALDGEIAIAYSLPTQAGENAIAPAQQIKEFVGKYKDKIDIVGGVFQGVYKSKEEMTEIASIPSLETLYGMFVNFLQQPVTGIALAIEAVAEQKQTQAA